MYWGSLGWASQDKNEYKNQEWCFAQLHKKVEGFANLHEFFSKFEVYVVVQNWPG